MPPARAQQEYVPELELLTTGQAALGAAPAHHHGDLHEAVRVDRMHVLVQVVTRERQRPVDEMQQRTGLLDREDFHATPYGPGEFRATSGSLRAMPGPAATSSIGCRRNLPATKPKQYDRLPWFGS